MFTKSRGYFELQAETQKKGLLNKRLSGKFLMKGQQVFHQTDPLVHGQLAAQQEQIGST